MFQITTATRKISALNKRICGISGGTSASKTVSILGWLIDRAVTDKEKETISVVSESMPHLKRGAIRDFLNIMQDVGFKDSRWNKTDFIYTFPSGSIIEFFSADQPGKVRGPRRDILFINEANNISYETYTQLEVRTKKIVWLDWNPVSEFWWYSEVLSKQDCDFITLTYKDNEALDPLLVQALEARKSNSNWWKIYGEGQLGEMEGKIYNSWLIMDRIPQEARLVRYGLDFGYTNDPTVIVAVYYWNGGFILDEVAYRTGLTNKNIVDILVELPRAMIIADSAEPKSIDEIRRYAFNIQPSTKGPGSVLQGIQYVQQQKIWLTTRSLNTIKEYRNYLWQTDNNGKIINEPEHLFSHSMDAVRYAIASFRTNEVKSSAVTTSKRIVPPVVWTVGQQGVQGQDFWQAFKDEQNRPKSTAGIEFKR